MTALWLLVALCGCTNGAAVAVPWVEAPVEVALDGLMVNRTTTFAVPVSNTGTARAVVRAVAAGDFAVPEDSQLSIRPGATGELAVLVTPPSYAPFDSVLVVTTAVQELEVYLLAEVTTDADGDGFEAVGAGGVDCDDGDAEIHPDGVEVWYDGVDQDCDGADDNDQDGDGWPVPDDCDDLDASVFPGATEVADGVDQDCNGVVDDGVPPDSGLLIIEIMRESAVPAGASGRWIELHNPTKVDASLDGIEVRIGTGITELADSGSVAAGGSLVLCVETNMAVNGGVPCDAELEDYASNTAIAVQNEAGVVFDEVDPSGWPNVAGASLELRADRFDVDANDAQTAWCYALTSYGSNADNLGTPGSTAPSCP